MTLESLKWIVVVNGLVQLAGLLVIVTVSVRNHREIVRMMRGVAGLVYQESDDTSVLVKCYVAEQGTPEALSLTSRHAVLSSALAPIEVTSALRRQERTTPWLT